MKTLCKSIPLFLFLFLLLNINSVSAQIISSGGQHSLVICSSDSIIRAYGRNDYGQLGNGNTTNTNTPVMVSVLLEVIAVAGGIYQSVALQKNGTVWAWGYNVYGQL